MGGPWLFPQRLGPPSRMPRIYRLALDVTDDGILRGAHVTRFPGWGQPAEMYTVLPPGWVAEHSWSEVLDELMERATYMDTPPFPGFPGDPEDEPY